MFKDHPAFLIGIAVLFGAALALEFHWSFAIVCIFFLFLTGWKRAILCSIFIISIFFYAKSLYFFPAILDQPIAVEGKFSIHNLAVQSSPFQKSYVYQGTLDTSQGKIPCRAYIPLKKERMPASSDLWIKATLVQKGEKNYVLKNLKHQKISVSFCTAEIRFKLKQLLRNCLYGSINDKKSAAFLLSMLTGEIDEKLLSYQCGRLGLQHILGVSGFQFVLLASLAGMALRLAFPYKTSIWILLILLGAYFWVLQDSPPVFRAYIMVAAVWIGRLVCRRMTALNALGFSLALQVALDPLVIRHLGFQLSYLCTGAILIVYPWMRFLFGKIMTLRSLEEARRMSFIDQHGYIASSMIRETLALNAAVHLLCIPILLFYFHKFSLMSLVYNLFFPLGAAAAYILCLFALALSLFFPPLGGVFLSWVGVLTTYLLTLSAFPPLSLDLSIRVKSLGMTAALLWAVGLLSLSLWGTIRSRESADRLRFERRF